MPLPRVIASGMASIDGRVTIAPGVLGPTFVHDSRLDLLCDLEAGALGREPHGSVDASSIRPPFVGLNPQAPKYNSRR
jgi:hypothetical protein